MDNSTLTPMQPVPDQATPVSRYKHLRLGKPDVLYPYFNTQQQLLGYIARWHRDEEGKKQLRPLCWSMDAHGKAAWRSVGFPNPYPLYNLPEIMARPEAPIIICEGEKAAEAAKQLFPAYVATTPMHGAQSPHLTNWQPVQGRVVYLCPDLDTAGDAFADAVFTLCRQAEARMVKWWRLDRLAECSWREESLKKRDEPILEGYDLADALAEGWTSKGITALWQEQALITPYFTSAERIEFRQEPDDDARFWLKETGVYYAVYHKDPKTKEDVKEWKRLCSFLRVAAQTRSHAQDNWGMVLELIDDDGVRKECILPSSMLAGDGRDYREILLSQGLKLHAGAHHQLQRYLTLQQTPERARCVESVGWHGSQYVLPQRVYGQSKGERLVLQSRHTVIPNFARQGTLVEWQQAIGQYAVGNSRLAFVISAALASVCLHLMREDNIAFHFAGASSIGKSTLLHCAASVMGAPLYSWRTTDNALEGIAAMSNDNVLLLDELGQIDGKAAASIAYMLGNGQAKTRANKYGATRPIQHFRNLVLSSGEIGLAHKLAENDRQQRAGEMVRFIELPADAGQQLGLFETLHGYPDSRSLADHLRTVAGHYQGMVMDAFLVMLTHDDRPAIINTLKKLQETWAAHHIPREANGQVARVGRKFALVAAVGELANSAGILNWPDNTASHAVATLFAAWQQEQHGQDSFEVTQTAAALQHFIATHGNSRFERLHDDDAGEQKIINRAGFRRTKDGITEYLLFPEVFAKEICVAGDAKAVARQLAQKGIIQKCRSGTTSQALRLPSLGNRRVYVIPITTLEGGLDHA